MPRATSIAPSCLGLVLVAPLLLTPLAGWPALMRLPVALVPIFAMLLLTVRPWRWRESQWAAFDAWQPSSRLIWSAALVAGVTLFWIVVTRFRSAEINAVDFTVYFDRPAFQTLRGHPLFIETADDLARARRSLLAIHAYWMMFPLALPYALYATPLWLLACSAAAVTAGAVHILRIMQRLGAGGALACASALAFLLNDNTARTLNYGFHPEVLYAWFIPWLVDAGLRRHRLSFLCAAVAAVLVKEDAFLLLIGVSVALALHGARRMSWAERLWFLALPPGIAAVNLAVYSRLIVPAFDTGGALFYVSYWANFGATPFAAVFGMIGHPWLVVSRTLTSGFLTRVVVPHVFLPFVGWRWMLGVMPVVLLYGASANEQLRSFGIYYAIVLVPFMVIAASCGALALADRVTSARSRSRLLASTVVVMGALLAGSTSAGYSLRPWRPEVTALPGLLAELSSERVVLVQSGLYPHAGYESRIQLLTPEALADPGNAGAVVVLAAAIGAYPFQQADLERVRSLPVIRPATGGLLAVRLPR